MTCTREDVLDILGTIDIKVPVEELNPAASLAEQGVDSLDMMNLYFSLEERFGVSVDEAALEEHDWSSVDAVAAGINALLGAKA